MKKLFSILFTFALFTILMAGSASAQLTGTKNIPGDYADLNAAITDLNTQGVGAGGVTLNLISGNPQTAPAGGYAITTLTGASGNPITVQGNGNTITASAALTIGALNDAIFKIIGTDYVTITGFTMLENAANTVTAAATNNMTEFGVALFYTTTTDGCQNITISNNTVTLNRTYQNTFGIYSNSTHSATAVTTSATATGALGGNHNLSITGNSISNVNMGIVVVGPTAAADMNNVATIGGSFPSANTLTDFGTTGTFSAYANVSGTVNGILVRNTNNFNISFNTVTSSVGGTTAGTLNGIQIPAFSVTPTGTFTNNINNNIISLQSAVVAGAINGINYLSGSASTTSVMNINNNNFNTFGHTVAASGTIIFIFNGSTHLTQSISSNTFTNMTVNTTGSVTFISNSVTVPAGGTQDINSNSIVTAFNKTGAGGTVTLFTSNASSTTGVVINNNSNNFSNITLTGATTMSGWSETDGGTPTKTVTGNTFNNWACGTNAVTGMSVNFNGGVTSVSNNIITNITGQGAISGLVIGSSGAATSVTISSNTINNLISTGTGGTVIGLSSGSPATVVNITGNIINTLSTTGLSSTVSGLVSTGATTNIFKNKIYDLSGNQAGNLINGMNITSGTTLTVYNNLIGDLRATAATGLNAINGINATGTTTFNIYYNSIYLNATSSSVTTFGTSCINFASTSTLFNLRNNVLVNLSTPAQDGSNLAANGVSATLRRSTGTTAVVPANYATTSNNNDFWCNPTAGTNNHLTYVEGTTINNKSIQYSCRI